MSITVKELTDLVMQNILWFVAGLAVLCLILLILCIILLARTRRPKSRLNAEELNADKVIEALESLDERMDALQHYAKNTHEAHERLAEKTRNAYSRVAIERYDAFPDCGGKQSFSVAVLNENKDGFLIRGITTRDSNRAYFNTITNGKTEIELSEEDKSAINKAGS